MSDELNEIIAETAELIRKSAHPTRGTIRVSPEVAAALESIEWTQTPSLDIVREGVREVAEKEGAETLEALACEVSECTKCGLHATRTQTVFADGNPHADLVFVGEAPGEQEDKEGLPFVGRAGKLLDDIIVKGMKLKRSDVYICNVVKCRPPGNRDPRPDEKEQCESYLIRQLELVRPKVICALGAHAAQSLLKTDTPIGRLRGEWHFYRGIPLRATYHPSYLLRSPGEKAKTWEDIQEVMKVLKGEVVPVPPFGS